MNAELSGPDAAPEWFQVVRDQLNIRVIAAVAFATTSINATRADDNADLIRRLQQQVQSLEQKVQALEGREADDVAAIERRAKASPTLTVGERGFGFVSADKDFALRLRGVLQVDSRTFFRDHGIAGNDGFLVRHEKKIEVAKNRPFDDGPGATDEEAVVASDAVVTEERARIELENAPEPQREVLVRRREAEAALAHG